MNTILERAAACAGKGDTARGTQTTRSALAAIQRGEFNCRDVSFVALVALRDEVKCNNNPKYYNNPKVQ